MKRNKKIISWLVLSSIILSLGNSFTVHAYTENPIPNMPDWVESDPVQALRVYISGKEVVGQTLTGNYTYYDPGTNYNYSQPATSLEAMKAGEEGTTYKWLRSDTKEGEYTPISGATGETYTLTADDKGKYIRFEVTPAGTDAQKGESWMVGPILSTDESSKVVDKYGDDSKSYLANVTNVQGEIRQKTANAIFFTVDSETSNQSNLTGSKTLFVNNIQQQFEESTQPIKHTDGKVYAPGDFFLTFLKKALPDTVGATEINGKKYYDLKMATEELGKKYWSGDENQSEAKNFQTMHMGQGLVVISDTENIFDVDRDRNLINEACNMLFNMNATEEQMEWFNDARYGMFVHFDMSSELELEISWDRRAKHPYEGNGGRFQNRSEPIYDSAYKHFEPETNSPKDWVDFAKKAGMKYVVLTSKHHAGFANFETHYSNYGIKEAPYKGDIVKEFIEEAHKQGLKVGLYYSIRDWYNGNLVEDHGRFNEFIYGQMEELMSNYGKVDIVWFDSINGGTYNDYDLRTYVRRMKQYNPDVIYNNRLKIYGASEAMPLPGDFTTPEQTAGGTFNALPWESCVTMLTDPTAATTGNTGYGWSYSSKYVMKSFEQSAQYVVTNAINDGNILYNVGPMSNGQITQAQKDQLMEVYDKIYKPYGEAIYGTKGNNTVKGNWGGSTCKENEDGTITLYLHVAPIVSGKTKPTTKTLTVPAPDNGNSYTSAKLIKEDGTKKEIALITEADGKLKVTLPADEEWSNIDTVIRLDSDVKASLAQKVAAAKRYVETFTATELGVVKASLNTVIEAAEAVLNQEGATTGDYSKQLIALKNVVERAEAAKSAWDVAESVERFKKSIDNGFISIGTEAFECTEATYVAIVSDLEELKNILADSETSKEAFTRLEVRLASDETVLNEILAAKLDEEQLSNVAREAKTVIGSEVYGTGYEGAKACDGSMNTRWATKDGTKSATLELKFDEAHTINTAKIQEFVGSGQDTRISNFALEYKKDGKWVSAYDGTKGGTNKLCIFDSVTSDEFRLNIKECNNVTIYEFSLFNLETPSTASYQATISADKTYLDVSKDTPDTAALTVAGTTESGEAIETFEKIEYFSDSKAVTFDESGKVSVGSFEGNVHTFKVWAKTTFNGMATKTNKITLVATNEGGTGKVNLAEGKTATAKSFWNSDSRYGAEKSIDGNDKTRWTAAQNDKNAWLAVDLSKPEKVAEVEAYVYANPNNNPDQEYLNVFEEVKIQYQDAQGNWVDVDNGKYEFKDADKSNGFKWEGTGFVDDNGNTVCGLVTATFDPIVAQNIRFVSVSAKAEPSIYEFRIFGKTAQEIVVEEVLTRFNQLVKAGYTVESFEKVEIAKAAVEALGEAASTKEVMETVMKLHKAIDELEKATTITGKVIDENGKAVSGATVKLNGTNPVKTGADGSYSYTRIPFGTYTITAQKDGFKADSVEVIANTSIVVAKNIKLKNEYTISFVGGEGAVGEAPDSVKGVSGDKVRLPESTFTKPGYLFKGWSDGDKIYAVNDEYTITKNVALIAVFEKVETPVKKHTVVLQIVDEKMGTVLMDREDGVYENGEQATIIATAKEGFTFVSWVNAAGEEVSKTASYTFTVTDDVTLIAKFKKIETKPEKPIEPEKPVNPSETQKPSEPNQPAKTGDEVQILPLVVTVAGLAVAIMVLLKKRG